MSQTRQSIQCGLFWDKLLVATGWFKTICAIKFTCAKEKWEILFLKMLLAINESSTNAKKVAINSCFPYTT